MKISKLSIKFQAYIIDIYFHEYKLAVQVDEYGHCDRDNEYEKERERKLKERRDCEVIKINPDESNFNINRAMNEIHRQIKKSVEKLTKEKTKKSLMDNVKRLKNSILI